MTYFLNIAKIHVNYAYKRMRKLQRKIGFAITNDFHYIIMFHFSKLYSVIKHSSYMCVCVCFSCSVVSNCS